jgi:hypothetical protein
VAQAESVQSWKNFCEVEAEQARCEPSDGDTELPLITLDWVARTRVRALSLKRVRVASLAPLSQASRLTSLSLENVDTAAADAPQDWRNLFGSSHLQSVELISMPASTALELLSAQPPALRSLTLTRLLDPHPPAVALVAPQLESLWLEGPAPVAWPESVAPKLTKWISRGPGCPILPAFGFPALSHWTVEGCEFRHIEAAIARMPNLDYLSLKLADLAPLDFASTPWPQTLRTLRVSAAQDRLAVNGAALTKNFAGTALEEFTLGPEVDVQNCSVGALPAVLRVLAVPGECLVSLDALPASVVSLTLYGPKLPPLHGLKKLRGLTNLALRGAAGVDLSHLAGNESLATLNLQDSQVMDLAPIALHPHVWLVNLTGADFPDLAPLFAAPKLERLLLTRSSELETAVRALSKRKKGRTGKLAVDWLDPPAKRP